MNVTKLKKLRGRHEKRNNPSWAAGELTAKPAIEELIWLDYSPNPIKACNPELSIIYVNAAFEQLTGFCKAELIGKKPPYPYWGTNDFLCYEQEMRQHLYSDANILERKLYRKSGEPFLVETKVSLVKQDERLKFVIFNWTDITDRKREQQVIRESQEFSSSLLENAPNAVIVINPDTSIRYVNPEFEKINGWTLDEIAGIKAPYPWWPEELKEAFMERFKAAFQQGSGQGEIISQKKNKERYWTAMKWSSVTRDGKLAYLLINSMDITERKRAELKIADSERRYRLVAENVTDVLWKVNIDSPTQLNYISHSIAHVLGYTVEEAMNKKMDDIFTRPSFTRAMKALEEEIAGQKEHIEQHRVKTLELELKHKDGSVVAVEVNWAFIQGTDGRPVEILAIARDITERKRAEVQRRQTEENLKAYLENAPDGVYISDSKGTFLYGNKKAEEITGYKREELLGKNFLEAGLLPKKQIATVAKLLMFNAAGRPTGPDELELVRKDGSRVRIEVNTTTVRQENKISVIGFVRDVTERNKMEVQIRRAAEEWGTTFDSITDFISIIDKGFKIVRVNRAFADALGKRPKDIIGKFCYEAIHKTNEPITKCPFRETLQTKKPVTAEFFEPTLGINLEATTAPILDEKGEIIGCVQVARDVTEREKMQEQLMLADRLASVGELASGIAHELNNPLTSIIGFTQLLMERDVADDMKGDLGLVNSEAQRCASIVKNLLTFGRKHAPVKQLGQVNDIIEDVLRLRAYERKVHNIEVERRFAPDLPQIMVDYFQMQQVFLNLIINAEYFMIQAHNCGLLTIVTEGLKSTVRISITDDGPGIPKENLSHLFNPFFTTKEVGKGTGLGLSICHGIVAEHGGKISATSQSGNGATFVVELPVNCD